jgi:hypothetical protein
MHPHQTREVNQEGGSPGSTFLAVVYLLEMEQGPPTSVVGHGAGALPTDEQRSFGIPDWAPA